MRAACVTCRRKKIKCSGEVPCTTCEEKKIKCEGLTERKRPQKNLDYHRRLEQGSYPHGSRPSNSKNAKTDSSRQSSLDSPSGGINAVSEGFSPSLRPTANLRKLNAVSSDDSGYGSGMRSGQDDLIPGQSPRLDIIQSINSTLANCDSSTEISPSTCGPHDWSFVRGHVSAGYCGTEATESDVSHTPRMTSAEWSDPRDRNTWWRDEQTDRPPATNLISAARVLEEQAQSLRRLASRRDADVTDGSRRQTIIFPLQPENGGSTNSIPHLPPGMFDDMAMSLADRGPGSAIMPMPSDFGSWWDIDPDLPTTLDFQQSCADIEPVPEFSALEGADYPDADWHYAMGQSVAPTAATSSRGTAQESQFFSASTPGSRPSTRGQRYSPANPSAQLYSWAERNRRVSGARSPGSEDDLA